MRAPFLIILLLCSSGSLSAQSLRSDSIATAILSSYELAAYDGLLAFADVKVGCKTYEESKTNCWEQFLSSAIDTSSGAMNIPWDLQGQQGFIGKMNLGEVTDSIWSTSRRTSIIENDSQEFFNLNFESCLGNLFSTAADNSEGWHDVWSAIKVTGELPPSLLESLFNAERNDLLSDPKMRLLLTLHMMTVIKNN